MNVEELRASCLAVKNATEQTPFGPDTMVYKIMGKMYAFFPLHPKDGNHFVVLKCNPERTVELRMRYEGVTKGYYAGNNLMWNSVYLERDVPDALIVALIEHSAAEVLHKLPKKRQEEYHALQTTP